MASSIGPLKCGILVVGVTATKVSSRQSPQEAVEWLCQVCPPCSRVRGHASLLLAFWGLHRGGQTHDKKTMWSVRLSLVGQWCSLRQWQILTEYRDKEKSSSHLQPMIVTQDPQEEACFAPAGAILRPWQDGGGRVEWCGGVVCC